MKRFLLIPVLALCLLLSGCGGRESPAQAPEEPPSEAHVQEFGEVEIARPDVSGAFSVRDIEGSYDEAAAIKIDLSGESAVCNEGAVSISGSTVTIRNEGVYILSGSLQGCIVVDAADTDKVQLVLSGAEISSLDGAAISVRQADKVFITLAEGTENTLSSPGGFESAEDNIDAAVFSRDDLTINGAGALSVSSPYGNGISSKDELTICGGSLTVTAAKHALEANDSAAICAGSLALSAGEDAVHCENEEDSSLGWVYISGGSFDIQAGDDGIHASGALLIEGGDISISRCNEGIEGKTVEISGGNIQITAGDDGINAADGSSAGGFGGSAGCAVLISGGSIDITADGDGIDSNGFFSVSGGDIHIAGANYGDSSIIDYETTGSYTGGIVFGTGAASMAENFSQAKNGGCIMLTVGSHSAGAEISLADADGNILLSEPAARDFSCVIIASADISAGETYSLSIDGEVTEISMDGAIYGSGGFGGFGGGYPGFGGGPQGTPPDMDNAPGTPPDMGSDNQGMPPDMGARPNGNPRR